MFVASGPSGAGLYVVNADGSGLRLIPGTGGAGAPAWSPDGRWIAFANDQISLIGPDGSGLRQVTHLGGLVADVPAWSPDGTRLAFVSSPPSGDAAMAKELEVMTLGSGVTAVRLPVTPTGDRPAWSPDGREIVVGDGDGGGLAAVSFDPLIVTRLTTGDASFAAWSPDGRELVFERGVPQPDGTELHQLFVASATGSSIRQLTLGPSDDEFPAWSPDGAWIAFTRIDGAGGSAIWRIRPDGTAASEITAGPGRAAWPSWSH